MKNARIVQLSLEESKVFKAVSRTSHKHSYNVFAKYQEANLSGKLSFAFPKIKLGIEIGDNLNCLDFVMNGWQVLHVSKQEASDEKALSGRILETIKARR